jgi:hypothetical protein
MKPIWTLETNNIVGQITKATKAIKENHKWSFMLETWGGVNYFANYELA